MNIRRKKMSNAFLYHPSKQTFRDYFQLIVLHNKILGYVTRFSLENSLLPLIKLEKLRFRK